MNLIAFGLILICCHAWAMKMDGNSRTNYANTKFGEFLENDCRSWLQNGNSDYGIPVVDPFSADELPINVNQSSPDLGNIFVEAPLSNVDAIGLSSYEVIKADFALFGLLAQVDLNWPLVTANTGYSLNADVAGFNIYGNGWIDAAVRNFEAQVNVSLEIRDQYVHVKSVSTKLSLELLDFQATGIFNDDEASEILSKLISNIVPEFVSNNDKSIMNFVNNILAQALDNILSSIKLKDLLDIIG